MSDTRTHVERINSWDDQQESMMTPEQFAQLTALMTDFLTPVKVLAEKQLAWMAAQEAAAAAQVEQAQPASSSDQPDATAT